MDRQERPTNALVLSGGGAKGMYQVAAVTEIQRQLGIEFDYIAGVSVGAINGAMLATGQWKDCVQMWETITEKDIQRRISIPKLLFRLLRWKVGFGKPVKAVFDNEPITKKMEEYLAHKEPLVPFYAGRVDLLSGEYYSATGRKDLLDKQVLASATIPGLWQPVHIADRELIDGGVRNVSPIWDVVKHEPDNIFIVTTENFRSPKSGKATDIFNIALSSISIMLKEIFHEDMIRFLEINDLVTQAEDNGHALYKGERKLKAFNTVVISPTVSLGSGLDYSRKTLNVRKKIGQKDTLTALEQATIELD